MLRDRSAIQVAAAAVREPLQSTNVDVSVGVKNLWRTCISSILEAPPSSYAAVFDEVHAVLHHFDDVGNHLSIACYHMQILAAMILTAPEENTTAVATATDLAAALLARHTLEGSRLLILRSFCTVVVAALGTPYDVARGKTGATPSWQPGATLVNARRTTARTAASRIFGGAFVSALSASCQYISGAGIPVDSKRDALRMSLLCCMRIERTGFMNLVNESWKAVAMLLAVGGGAVASELNSADSRALNAIIWRGGNVDATVVPPRLVTLSWLLEVLLRRVAASIESFVPWGVTTDTLVRSVTSTSDPNMSAADFLWNGLPLSGILSAFAVDRFVAHADLRCIANTSCSNDEPPTTRFFSFFVQHARRLMCAFPCVAFEPIRLEIDPADVDAEVDGAAILSCASVGPTSSSNSLAPLPRELSRFDPISCPVSTLLRLCRGTAQLALAAWRPPANMVTTSYSTVRASITSTIWPALESLFVRTMLADGLPRHHRRAVFHALMGCEEACGLQPLAAPHFMPPSPTLTARLPSSQRLGNIAVALALYHAVAVAATGDGSLTLVGERQPLLVGSDLCEELLDQLCECLPLLSGLVDDATTDIAGARGDNVPYFAATFNPTMNVSSDSSSRSIDASAAGRTQMLAPMPIGDSACDAMTTASATLIHFGLAAIGYGNFAEDRGYEAKSTRAAAFLAWLVSATLSASSAAPSLSTAQMRPPLSTQLALRVVVGINATLQQEPQQTARMNRMIPTSFALSYATLLTTAAASAANQASRLAAMQSIAWIFPYLKEMDAVTVATQLIQLPLTNLNVTGVHAAPCLLPLTVSATAMVAAALSRLPLAQLWPAGKDAPAGTATPRASTVALRLLLDTIQVIASSALALARDTIAVFVARSGLLNETEGGRDEDGIVVVDGDIKEADDEIVSTRAAMVAANGPILEAALTLLAAVACADAAWRGAVASIAAASAAVHGVPRTAAEWTTSAAPPHQLINDSHRAGAAVVAAAVAEALLLVDAAPTDGEVTTGLHSVQPTKSLVDAAKTLAYASLPLRESIRAETFRILACVPTASTLDIRAHFNIMVRLQLWASTPLGGSHLSALTEGGVTHFISVCAYVAALVDARVGADLAGATPPAASVAVFCNGNRRRLQDQVEIASSVAPIMSRLAAALRAVQAATLQLARGGETRSDNALPHQHFVAWERRNVALCATITALFTSTVRRPALDPAELFLPPQDDASTFSRDLREAVLSGVAARERTQQAGAGDTSVM